MRSFSAILLLLPFCAAAVSFRPRAVMTVNPPRVVLTETADVQVSVDLPIRLPDTPTYAADFIREDTPIRLEQLMVKIGGTNYMRYVAHVPVLATAPGVVNLGSVSVGLPVRTSIWSLFDNERVTVRSNPARLHVFGPPEDSAPRSYSGAIATNLAVRARLDAQVCTAGDPLLLTLELSGMTDPSRVSAPEIARAFRDGPFRLDAASLKTSTHGAAKSFVWRVRAVRAGTFEFPSLSVGWFEIPSRSFRETTTEPIPVQVKAGAQAALGVGAEAEAEEDAFPMPDGLDLDFDADGTAEFTLKRAFALATTATNAAAFAAAADAYRDYLERRGGELPASARARHWANLGALETLAGRPLPARKAFTRSEWLAGATPGTTRGLRAALARAKKDPRAELPPWRLMAPFWYRLTLAERAAAGAGVALVLALLFLLALKAGRRLAVFALAVGGACSAAFAGGSMRLEPGVVSVGQPAAFVLSFPVQRDETVENLSCSGLPEADGVEYGEFETHTNGTYRLPVRFLRPFSATLHVRAQGMKTVRRSGGGFFSKASRSFGEQLPPFRVDVVPLPEAGRPADFSGAVATRFNLFQRVEPERVHPGDLVTVTYRLFYSGYFPTNVAPRLAGETSAFKVYPLKEVGRTKNGVIWQQMLVPQSTAATNTPSASLSWYDASRRRYEQAVAFSRRLTFVSDEAASTENAVVVMDASTPSGGGASAENGIRAALVLHFAPSDRSPVVATLPPGTPAREVHRTARGWRRVISDGAAGWTR